MVVAHNLKLLSTSWTLHIKILEPDGVGYVRACIRVLICIIIRICLHSNLPCFLVPSSSECILVTLGGAYAVKNIITFHIRELSFLMTWTIARYGLQKFDSELFFLLLIQFWQAYWSYDLQIASIYVWIVKLTIQMRQLLPRLTILLHAMLESKRTLPTSTSLQHVLR